VVFLAVWLFAAVPAHAALDFLQQWSGANGGFDDPFGVATDPAGNVYVADSGNDRVQTYTPEGQLVRQWGSSGNENGEFDLPRGITVGPDGLVYVVDSGDGQPDSDNDRVQIFNTGGQFLDLFGSEGTGLGEFDFPFGVATSGAGNVYVTDQGNARVEKFTPTGLPLLEWGSAANFDQPLGIAVDSAGYVYVVDGVNENVQKFDPVGTAVDTFDSFGSAGGLGAPIGITAAPDGTLYVADSGNDRVLNVTPQGALIDVIGGPGPGNGTFLDPTGVATDCRGNLYVLDSGHGVVQKFGDPEDPPPPCTPAPPPAGLQLRVDAKPRQKVKKLAITITCPLEDCAADMGGKVKGKERARLSPQEHDLEAGRPLTVKLRYQGNNTLKRLRKALKKKKVRRKARAAVAVEATDAAGQSQLEQLQIKLRR